jgi:hypothetical protein
MTELQLCLDFLCCACEDPIGMTVSCSGKGLAAGPRTTAAVRVPCPDCGAINEVCFRPTGEVVAVRPAEARQRTLTPSAN